MSNLCIIPARGGSKRIPKKNIKPFLGKPIIAYSIEVANSANLFDEVMVSTDDFEIEEISKKYGAKVPFKRSKKNSDDFASTFDVIEEVILNYKSLGREFDTICCIYPCAPFISVNILSLSYNKLVDLQYDTVFPIMEYNFPIQRALKVNSDKKIEMIDREHVFSRSQDLVKSYHDAGQFYWAQVPQILKRKTLLTDNSGAVIISQLEGQDIDNDVDWKIAEVKFRLIHE